MNEDILDGDFKGNDFKEVPISYASFCRDSDHE
jgi:hypothetical protein